MPVGLMVFVKFEGKFTHGMEFRIIDDTLQFYNLMLIDIAQAKEFIFLETYKFANDHMGIRFRDALTKKSKEGVKVKILIDSWGKGPVSETFSLN